ncbi:hypothetical protein [Christensenella minuta]|uniref:hypothetical protein n=1 Tax=Christensenella minuta TaxID=626937 RepID=UPI00215839D6|nr:hypothetical protein [Christensenella minuta]
MKITYDVFVRPKTGKKVKNMNMSYILSDTITTEDGKPLMIIPSRYTYPNAEQKERDRAFFRNFMNKVNGHTFSVLTPDIDSLATCCYLEDEWGIPIGGYYDFNKLVVSDEILSMGRNHPFYADCDVNGYEWGIGNHVRVVGENGMCFNLNDRIVADSYTKNAGLPHTLQHYILIIRILMI